MITAQILEPTAGVGIVAQVAPFDLTAKGWDYAAANGPFAVIAFIVIVALCVVWWHAERVKAKLSADKERLREERDALLERLRVEYNALQDKRVLDREELMRSLVTCNIALQAVSTSTDANNRAIEALTRAVDATVKSIDAFTAEVRGLRQDVALMNGKVERALEPRGRH